QDFADQALGQLRPELDLLRHLVASHPRVAIVDDLLLGGRLAVPQHYVYLDRLAPAWVGHADGDDFAHFGMLEQRLLDIARIHVHAAADDHVLLAVDDAEVAVSVLAGDVARIQPAIAQDLRGLIRPIPVALHHLRPAHRQFTHLAWRQLARAALLVEDGSFGR